ncbi:hypothetical protein HGM15179_001786 [Zosterops borbonicus]|uniref:Uncharacterized protein n=1 Tax=Zosterops borbonicus TaxID=364589 RepID=A0A8K1GTW0_9PASS|nr:hypothetical protein HGM15179_001786 [Zosterops borbonicus]
MIIGWLESDAMGEARRDMSDNESVTELIKETTSPDEAEGEKAVAGDFHRHNTKLNTDGDDFNVEVELVKTWPDVQPRLSCGIKTTTSCGNRSIQQGHRCPICSLTAGEIHGTFTHQVPLLGFADVDKMEKLEYSCELLEGFEMGGEQGHLKAEQKELKNKDNRPEEQPEVLLKSLLPSLYRLLLEF